MPEPLHSRQTLAYVHAPISFEYADAAARTGATGFQTTDLYKFAWQLDDGTMWILIDTVTPTWQQIASGLGSMATDTLTWGSRSVYATTTTRYLQPWYSSRVAITSPEQWRVPRAGTLRNFRVRHNRTAGNGNLITYRLRINGVGSAIGVSLASTASDGADLVNTATLAAGDLLDIEVTKTLDVGASPLGVLASVEFA